MKVIAIPIGSMVGKEAAQSLKDHGYHVIYFNPQHGGRVTVFDADAPLPDLMQSVPQLEGHNAD